MPFDAAADTEDKISAAIVEAILQANQPLVRLAMEYKVPADRFARLIARSFVKTAEADAINSDHPLPDDSAIAARTGLTRQSVGRIRTADHTGTPNPSKRPPHALRVLQAWKTDTDFIDELDQPKVLPLRGRVISFHALVKRQGHGLRPTAILRELERIKAVRLTKENRVELLNRPDVDNARRAQLIKDLGEFGCEFLESLVYTALHPDLPRYHRRAVGIVKINEVGTLVRDISASASVWATGFQDTMTHQDNAVIPGPTAQKATRLSGHFFISERPHIVPPIGKRVSDDPSTTRKRKRNRR
jgi:hypothetical protein